MRVGVYNCTFFAQTYCSVDPLSRDCPKLPKNRRCPPNSIFAEIFGTFRLSNCAAFDEQNKQSFSLALSIRETKLMSQF